MWGQAVSGREGKTEVDISLDRLLAKVLPGCEGGIRGFCDLVIYITCNLKPTSIYLSLFLISNNPFNS